MQSPRGDKPKAATTSAAAKPSVTSSSGSAAAKPRRQPVKTQKTGDWRGNTRASKDIDPWRIAENWKPPRLVADSELQQAKKLFWELDRDGSGSIESDEIAFMLRSMGQNPDKKQVEDLIKKYDTGDKDGKIQLREFLMMYTYGLDDQKSSDSQDVIDTFSALNVNPEDEKARVPKEELQKFLKEKYELEVDVDDVFGAAESELSLKHFGTLLESSGK